MSLRTLLTAASAAALACDPPTPDVARDCAPTLVVDVDETLTTSDDEWLATLFDAAHDAAMRPDADTLVRRWSDAGYTTLYVTARGEASGLPDGRSAREATDAWLTDHGFPRTSGDLFLSPDYGVVGEDAHAYKTEVLTDLAAARDLLAAYGNAESDIAAYQDTQIPQIWLVGVLAGQLGVPGIPDDQAFTAHLDELNIPTACP